MRRRVLWVPVLAAALYLKLGMKSARADAPVVEVNHASRAVLESVPGLGPALVQRLMAARPFADWGDLMQRVPGIKAATARRLSGAGLRVQGAAFDSAAGREPR